MYKKLFIANVLLLLLMHTRECVPGQTTPLHTAVKENDNQSIERLLGGNIKDEKGFYPLAYLEIPNPAEDIYDNLQVNIQTNAANQILERLLQAGTPVHTLCPNGLTLLANAITKRSILITETLLTHGADIYQLEQDKETTPFRLMVGLRDSRFNLLLKAYSRNKIYARLHKKLSATGHLSL